MRNHHLRSAPITALVLAAACWGGATVITKHVLTDVPPLTLLVLQLTVSVAFLAIAGGLMFWVNEVDAGLLVVSHLVALGAGAVAAARWTRRTFEGTRDRM